MAKTIKPTKKTTKATVKKKPSKKTIKTKPKTDIPKEETRGRKSALDDPEIKAKFLVAASFDMNITACAAYAGISTQAYYNYIDINPEFLDEVERNKQLPYQRAVQTVVKAIDTDPKIALAYLERRAKKEFSPRTEITGADGEKLIGGLAGLVSEAQEVLDEHGESTAS